jgi:hypothetical protein
MKNFKQYLAESAKTYGFRITFAGKPDKDIQKIVKHSLAGYKVQSVSDLKSYPVVKDHPLFPGVANAETYSLDVVCDYPVSPDQVRVALTQATTDRGEVAVQNLYFADDLAQEQERIAANTDDKALLEKPYDASKLKIADYYGDDYNSKLVKNSASGAGQVKVKGGAKAAETTNDLPQGKKSAMGSVKAKLPDVKSFRR